MSLDSGAVAYSHTGSRRSGASRSRLSILAMSSVDRVVVGVLVPAGSLLVERRCEVTEHGNRVLSEATLDQYWRYVRRWKRAGCPPPADWLSTLTLESSRTGRSA